MRVGYFIQLPLTVKVCYVIYYTQFSDSTLIYIVPKDGFISSYTYFMTSIPSTCCLTNNLTGDTAKNPLIEKHELEIIVA